MTRQISFYDPDANTYYSSRAFRQDASVTADEFVRPYRDVHTLMDFMDAITETEAAMPDQPLPGSRLLISRGKPPEPVDENFRIVCGINGIFIVPS